MFVDDAEKNCKIIASSNFHAHSTRLFYDDEISKMKDIYRYGFGINMYMEYLISNIYNSEHCYRTRSRTLPLLYFQRFS